MSAPRLRTITAADLAPGMAVRFDGPGGYVWRRAVTVDRTITGGVLMTYSRRIGSGNPGGALVFAPGERLTVRQAVTA